MKYKVSKGGVLFKEEKTSQEHLVKPSKQPPSKIYTFEVYYSSDLIKFLEIMEKKAYRGLLSVVKNWYPNGISAGWVITYSATERIEMEVLC